MDTIESDIDQLDRYLRAACDSDEKEQIEKRLAEDQAFRDLLDDLEIMQEALARMTDDSEVAEAESAEGRVVSGDFSQDQNTDGMAATVTVNRHGLWQRNVAMAVAASLALLMAAWFLLKPAPLTSKLLADSYYELPASPGSEMSGQEVFWAKGVEAYRKQDFREAASFWRQLPAPTSEQRYYLAHALYNSGDLQGAVESFVSVSNDSGVHSFNAEWDLAMAYLASDNAQAAKQVLTKITGYEGHPFTEEAREVLDEMTGLPE